MRTITPHALCACGHRFLLGPHSAVGAAFDPSSSPPSSSAWSLGPWPPLCAAALAFCGVFLLLRRPALSTCACCAPTWAAAYSLPLALLLGRARAKANLAFTPVPDLPVQLPLIIVLLLAGVID